MLSERTAVPSSFDRMTHRQTGGIAVLGGLLAVLATGLTYGPYIGPFAPSGTGPFPDVLPIIVTQMGAGSLLAVACLTLPTTIRETGGGTAGRYLSAGAFGVVSLFPLPVWVLLGTPAFGRGLVITGIGYLGVLGLAIGIVLLARRLADEDVLTRAEALTLALSLPLGITGYRTLGWIGVGGVPPPLFGPTLFLAPLGLAWILAGYRIGTLA